jgi:TrmH family RNA methyltransferase
VLEGPDLVLAALGAGVRIEAVYFDARATAPGRTASAEALSRAAAAGVRVVELADGVLDRVTDAMTPQPVLAVAAMPATGLDVVPTEGFSLVLCDVRDPGNLGTAVRAADASGAACVVVAGDCVDVFNPKTLRATAGSVFHLPIAVVPTLDAATAALRATGRRVLGAVVHGGEPLWSAPLGARCAVVIGSEATGLGESDLAACDATITIPMAGRAESLNAGVAAALVCFESLRRTSAVAEGPTI